MTGYKFYITKSREAADLICNGLRATTDKEGQGVSIGSGPVKGDCRIPEVYHDYGLFYASVEYRALDRTKYEIVFC